MGKQFRLSHILISIFLILFLFSLIQPLYEFDKGIRSLQTDIEKESMMNIFILAQGIDRDIKIGNWADVQAYLRRINNVLSYNIHLQIIATDGQIIADSRRIEPVGQLHAPIITQATTSVQTISQHLPDTHIYQIAMPLANEQDKIVATMLYTFDWETQFQALRAENLREMLVFVSVIGTTSIIVFIIMWYWAARPLNALYDLTTAIINGKNDERAPAFRITEFHQVGIAINRMLDNNMQQQNRLENEVAERKAIAIELEQYHHVLETRVEERTYELQLEIAEGKQTEQALRESEERYRAIVELSPDAIVVYIDGKFVYVNPAGLQLLGAPNLDDIIGLPIIDRVHPDYRQITLQRAKVLQHRPNTVLPTIEEQFIRFDGTVIDVEVLGSLIHYEGKVASLVIFRDITERKASESSRVALLVERERIELLTHFITQASHEFRTPLSIINTSIYLLTLAKDDDKRQYHIDKITAEVKNITTLINNLTTMSTLDNSKEIPLERLNINDMVQHAIKFFNKYDIQIKAELTSIPLFLYGNQDYLEEALNHIVNNAVNFTEADSEIIVQTKSDNDMAIIEVKDKGIGIDESDLPHVFKRFYRGDKVGKTRGFGLGLPIVKRIVEHHNGDIEIETKKGEGSIFRILIPMNANTQKIRIMR